MYQSGSLQYRQLGTSQLKKQGARLHPSGTHTPQRTVGRMFHCRSTPGHNGKYKEATGQGLQKKATPIREGVIVISEETTIQQLQDLAENWKNALECTPSKSTPIRMKAQTYGTERKKHGNRTIMRTWSLTGRTAIQENCKAEQTRHGGDADYNSRVSQHGTWSFFRQETLVGHAIQNKWKQRKLNNFKRHRATKQGIHCRNRENHHSPKGT